MTKLAFHHVGPAVEPTIAVPAAIQCPDYFLVYDPTRRTLVYGISPDYHQGGLAWAFDGNAFTPISTTTYRLGSQQGAWTGLYDPTRNAIVAWAFDSDGPYGVIVGESLSVILHTDCVADHESMEQSAPTIVVSGDKPAAPEEGTWDNLTGIFGMDPKRRVTVCLTQGGIYELAGDRWTRVADAPKKLPEQVDGDRNSFSGGAGAVWDAPRGELVFWMHDGESDKVSFHTWDGRESRKLATKGLPKLWDSSDDNGFAIGDHPQHGVVVYAGPKCGLFGRTDDGWATLPTGDDAPPRSKAGHMAFDPARDALVHGPYVLDAGDQHVLHELVGGRWKRIGATRTKSLLEDLSSGFQGFGRSRGAMHAVGLYMKTIAWDPQTSWRSVVDESAADKARGNARAQAFVTAWEGVLHAIMDDGSVMSLEPTTWKTRAGASSTWKDPFFPLVAFDEARGVLVAWGSKKKSGGRKNDTFVFEKGAWTKAKKAKDKPADLELEDPQAFELFYDATKKQVARLGKTEIAHFNGETWIPTTLRDGTLIETWRRCVCPHAGTTVVVNMSAREVLRIAGDTVTKVGSFDPPAPRDEQENLPFDRWWFDEDSLSLIVHNDIDDAQSFALDLRPAFA